MRLYGVTVREGRAVKGCDEARERAVVGGRAGARSSKERSVRAISPAGPKILRCGYARTLLRRNELSNSEKVYLHK